MELLGGSGSPRRLVRVKILVPEAAAPYRQPPSRFRKPLRLCSGVSRCGQTSPSSGHGAQREFGHPPQHATPAAEANVPECPLLRRRRPGRPLGSGPTPSPPSSRSGRQGVHDVGLAVAVVDVTITGGAGSAVTIAVHPSRGRTARRSRPAHELDSGQGCQRVGDGMVGVANSTMAGLPRAAIRIVGASER